jgi:tetraacyldisaccharide 4'-kinase
MGHSVAAPDRGAAEHMKAGEVLLTPLALLYGGAIGLRNVYYDRWPGAVHRVGVPVISVVNLSVGGTGKTPLVIEIVRRLQSWGRRPAILTRGYKAAGGAVADEVLEISADWPDVPVVVNPDRVAGGRTACAAGADCLVLDDGFQHRRLARDLDIVLISALGPANIGRLLPAGRLREPLSSLRRADVLVLTRSNQVDEARLNEIRACLRRYCPDAPIVHAAVEAASPPAIEGRRVLAVCGIGEPRTFLELLGKLIGERPPARIFRDHHRYDESDVRAICAAAQKSGADQVVTTRKDWVKLRALWPDVAVPLLRVDIRSTVTTGGAALDERLRQALEHTP